MTPAQNPLSCGDDRLGQRDRLFDIMRDEKQRAPALPHETYGVAPAMYRHLFEGLRDAVREALGEDWSSAYANAWTARLEALLGEIESAVKAASA